MANVSPEAFAVLQRVKRYGLDTWRTNAMVISREPDADYARAHRATIAALLATGHLALDRSGIVIAGLAGEHELQHRETSLNESRATIGGQRLQVITDDWAIESEAAVVRTAVLTALEAVAASDPARFERIGQAAIDGTDDDDLRALVDCAVRTAAPHGAGGQHARRVGVRSYALRPIR